MMVRGDRIDALLREKGWSQGELSRRVGVSQQTIWKLVSGGVQGSKHLHRIARELDTTTEYLSGESDDRHPLVREERHHQGYADADDLPDIVEIKEAKLELGLGGSYLGAHVEERMIPFPRDWVRQFSDAPPQMLVFVRGRGTSMEPSVRDGDICLIDLSRRRIDEQDELWAVAYGELGMVKRLRALPDGTVKIMSDNQSVRDEHATDGELHVIGRCVGVFRKT